jgi:hypothetical protein
MAKTMAKMMIGIEILMPALTPLERPLGVEEAVAVVPALLVAIDLLVANVLIDGVGVPVDTVVELDITVVADSAADELSSFNISVSVPCHATGIPSFQT